MDFSNMHHIFFLLLQNLLLLHEELHELRKMIHNHFLNIDIYFFPYKFGNYFPKKYR